MHLFSLTPGSQGSFLWSLGHHRPPHSFPTRRSSDLWSAATYDAASGMAARQRRAGPQPCRDRKSTRLNSSHPSTSYAVFCLKKKIDFESFVRTYASLLLNASVPRVYPRVTRAELSYL